MYKSLENILNIVSEKSYSRIPNSARLEQINSLLIRL